MSAYSLRDIWETKVISLKEFQALNRLKQLEFLVTFGILAPTSHNTNPEKFHLDIQSYGITVCIDRKYILPESDKKGRQASISIGCVIKNIEVAAHHYNLKTNIEILPVKRSLFSFQENGSQQVIQVAKLTFFEEKDSVTQNETQWPLLKTLLERKVVRGEYDDALALPPDIAKNIQLVVKEIYPLVHLHVFSEKNQLHNIGKHQEDADRTVFEDSGFTYELGNWLLENDDLQHNSGMRGVEFGFTDEFAKKIHNGLLRKSSLLPDQIAGFARGGKIGIESCSGVGIFTVTNDDLTDWITVGRAYEHLALLIQEAKLTTSVFAGIVEVEWVNRVFSASVLHTMERATLLFRVGLPKRKLDLERPHSTRPSLSDFLIKT